ncbi:YlbF family regulator (plasmid) [Halorussus limi]|uniref:YlbF family regulator n=1 Tax=Halorussus limi TaxID=2938695 RepID=A0A8U0I1G4_9EURY|nr:halo-CC-star protein HcsL [Halorussus limi]UPV77029.1 YlbF family regulator [Halorussus limi]
MSKVRSDEEPVEASFQTFVEMLTDSETYQEFTAASRALENDSEATALLEEYREKQQRMQRDGYDQSLLSELRELKSEMADNETIQRHKDAQETLVDLLQETNDAISEQIGRKFARSTGGGCC